MTYTLYIGADNETHELDLQHVERLISDRHSGFTLHLATGYWLGSKEQSAVIVIDDDEASILATINILKAELHQDAIGYQVAPQLQFA